MQKTYHEPAGITLRKTGWYCCNVASSELAKVWRSCKGLNSALCGKAAVGTARAEGRKVDVVIKTGGEGLGEATCKWPVTKAKGLDQPTHHHGRNQEDEQPPSLSSFLCSPNRTHHGRNLPRGRRAQDLSEIAQKVHWCSPEKPGVGQEGCRGAEGQMEGTWSRPTTCILLPSLPEAWKFSDAWDSVRFPGIFPV